jgi:NADPH:quinone reductase-like Zn-dependent oxidoreductase
MQVVPSKEAIGSVIRVGDVVKVLKRGDHFFVAKPEKEAQRPVL